MDEILAQLGQINTLLDVANDKAQTIANQSGAYEIHGHIEEIERKVFAAHVEVRELLDAISTGRI